MCIMRCRELVTKECSKVCIRVNRLALPESGERKRNLTTTGLGENKRQSETRPAPTKSSQSPFRIRSVQVEGVKELGSDKLVLLVSSCGITYLFSSIGRIHSRKGNPKVWISRKEHFKGYQGFNRPFSVNLEVTIRGFDIDNMAAQQAIHDSKALHARRWQTKEGTYTASKSNSSQMSVMVEMSVRVLRHPPLTLSITLRAGLATIIWVTNLLWLDM